MDHIIHQHLWDTCGIRPKNILIHDQIHQIHVSIWGGVSYPFWGVNGTMPAPHCVNTLRILHAAFLSLSLSLSLSLPCTTLRRVCVVAHPPRKQNLQPSCDCFNAHRQKQRNVPRRRRAAPSRCDCGRPLPRRPVGCRLFQAVVPSADREQGNRGRLDCRDGRPDSLRRGLGAPVPLR